MVFRDQSLDTEKWSLLLGQLPFLLNTNISVAILKSDLFLV